MRPLPRRRAERLTAPSAGAESPPATREWSASLAQPRLGDRRRLAHRGRRWRRAITAGGEAGLKRATHYRHGRALVVFIAHPQHPTAPASTVRAAGVVGGRWDTPQAMLTVRARRLLILLAALVALVLAGCAGVTTTPGHVGAGAQNRVWALNAAAPTLAGPSAAESSCSRQAFAVSAAQLAAGFCVAAEEAGAAGRGVNFIVHPNGDVLPVPDGAEGPTLADNGDGFQFKGGSGGHGLDPKTTGVRIMDPVTSGPYQYPNGYASYFNESGQTVNPFTGRTIANNDPFAHQSF